jgi:KDO2-lipid IV(A) lauroyltransferase
MTSLGDRTLLLFVKGFFGLINLLPLPVALAYGRHLGWVYGHVIRYHRKDALEAAQRSLPEKSPKEIKAIINRMYLNLGMNAIESIRLTRFSMAYADKYIRVIHPERIKQVMDQGKGGLGLMGHIGNWEMMAVLGPMVGLKNTIIVKKIKPPALNEYLVGTREKMGLRVLPKQHVFRQAIKILKANESVGFILDQNVIEREGIFVDFFGKPACTTPGLAMLAVKTGAPVLPMFVIRRGNAHHDIICLEPLDPPSRDDPNGIAEFTQRCTRLLEDMIREHPEQWIWIHRRWRTQPGDGVRDEEVVASDIKNR